MAHLPFSSLLAMPQLKLTYFTHPGRAEITRLAFTAAGISFEDERVTNFPALKPTLPLGQLPVLTVDGAEYPQSMAIARYAARVGGFYPSDPLQALKVDMVVDTLQDLAGPIMEIMMRTPDEKEKAEKTKVVEETTLPRVFGFIESRIEGKFLLGEELSLADLYVFNIHSYVVLRLFPTYDFSAYPKIAAIVGHVKLLPRIAAYIAKKP
ncbi:hypothetical protein Poli38472_011866 [Pythium oligandrum]|uniref:Glutathione S-transferase n=1 Tax=Pythium oligandrum TaxID=41045 RepID=A0A8K1C8B9_PYTOL|nr:hypothetical protein Poli38472_011866 [Pythium oligandrum]|eukprot:TMW58278.1 hypothetical protein Poli38472_011866 [Pythium oligandrum]